MGSGFRVIRLSFIGARKGVYGSAVSRRVSLPVRIAFRILHPTQQDFPMSAGAGCQAGSSSYQFDCINPSTPSHRGQSPQLLFCRFSAGLNRLRKNGEHGENSRAGFPHGLDRLLKNSRLWKGTTLKPALSLSKGAISIAESSRPLGPEGSFWGSSPAVSLFQQPV